jgi:TatA/E family protein of Tat protein translocase
MPFNIQGPELIILLIIALVVLGPGKLPEVGSALGRSIREFRKAASDVKEATSIEPAKASGIPADPPPLVAPSGQGPAAQAPLQPATQAQPVAAAPTSDTDAPAS